jgi:hypothetical protein
MNNKKKKKKKQSQKMMPNTHLTIGHLQSMIIPAPAACPWSGKEEMRLWEGLINVERPPLMGQCPVCQRGPE